MTVRNDFQVSFQLKNWNSLIQIIGDLFSGVWSKSLLEIEENTMNDVVHCVGIEIEGKKACGEPRLSFSDGLPPVSFKIMGRDFHLYHASASVVSFMSKDQIESQELCGNLQLICGTV